VILGSIVETQNRSESNLRLQLEKHHKFESPQERYIIYQPSNLLVQIRSLPSIDAGDSDPTQSETWKLVNSQLDCGKTESVKGVL
jgi:hypothetical protein